MIAIVHTMLPLQILMELLAINILVARVSLMGLRTQQGNRLLLADTLQVEGLYYLQLKLIHKLS
jgi:hypothetical protein